MFGILFSISCAARETAGRVRAVDLGVGRRRP
jgi:hypothetical protein